MLNQKVLQWMQENIDGIEDVLHLRYEEFTWKDLLTDIRLNNFVGRECLLPFLFFGSEDVVVMRTYRRLFLQLFKKELEASGGDQLIRQIKGLLEEEKTRHSVWLQRMQELKA